MTKRLSGVANRLNASRSATDRTSSASKGPKLLAAQPLAGARPILRADHAADHQKHGEHNIDRLVRRRLNDRRISGDKNDLKQRCADYHIGRNPQKIDHRRHHDESAANAHYRGQKPDERAEPDDRDGGDIELGDFEAQLQRQPVNPVMLARLLEISRRPQSCAGAVCARIRSASDRRPLPKTRHRGWKRQGRAGQAAAGENPRAEVEPIMPPSSSTDPSLKSIALRL